MGSQNLVDCTMYRDFNGVVREFESPLPNIQNSPAEITRKFEELGPIVMPRSIAGLRPHNSEIGVDWRYVTNKMIYNWVMSWEFPSFDWKEYLMRDEFNGIAHQFCGLYDNIELYIPPLNEEALIDQLTLDLEYCGKFWLQVFQRIRKENPDSKQTLLETRGGVVKNSSSEVFKFVFKSAARAHLLDESEIERIESCLELANVRDGETFYEQDAVYSEVSFKGKLDFYTRSLMTFVLNWIRQ